MRTQGADERRPDAGPARAAALLSLAAILLAGLLAAGCKCSPSSPESSSKAARPGQASEKLDGPDRVAALFKDDPERYKVFQSVQADYRSSRLDDAIQKLETLLKESPEAPWAELVQFQLAQALTMTNRLPEALRQLDLFLEHYPNSPSAPDAMLFKGEINLRIGKERKGDGPVNAMSKFYLDKALRIFEEIRSAYPDNPEIGAQCLYFIGSTYEEMEDLTRAAEAFRRVVDEYPETDVPSKALFSLAGVYLSEGDVDAAERAFGEITDRDPRSLMADKARSRLEGIGLVGYEAPPLVVKEWIGEPPPEVQGMKGKATLIDFWAIWCPHCKRSIPRIDKLARDYGPDGLNVVGMSRERENFEADAIREYIRTHPMGFPTAIDDGGKTSAAYAVSSIPRIVVVDAQGKIRWHGHPEYLTDKVIQMVLQEPPGL